MSFEITGRLEAKGDVEQITPAFKKREFTLKIVENINGIDYENYVKLQLMQAKVGIIDPYVEGDEIKVFFNIRGNKVERDGKVLFYTNLNAWRIEDAPQNYDPWTKPEAPGPESADDLPF